MEIPIQTVLIKKLRRVIYKETKFFYYLKLDPKLSIKQVYYPREIIRLIKSSQFINDGISQGF